MDSERLLTRVRTPHKLGQLLLAPTGRVGDFDSHAVDCPFVFPNPNADAGSPFLMSYIGFDGSGYRTGLASSDDLVSWRREGMLMDRGAPGSVTEHNVALTWILRDNDLFGSGELRRIDGRYVGTYHAYPKPGYEAGPAVIGMCLSDDLRTWDLSEPVLRAGDGAEWEHAGLYKSCIVEFPPGSSHRFAMYYNAKNRENDWLEQTGVAFSDDLVRWERYDGNPVLPVGPAGAFDDVFASDPCVLRVDDAYAMFYFGLSSDGYARDGVAFSRDGLRWQKSDEVLIDVGAEGEIDSRYAHKPSLFAHNGQVFHYYCAVAPKPPGSVGDVDYNQVRGITAAVS